MERSEKRFKLMRKYITSAALMGLVFSATPAFAQTTSTATSTPAQLNVTCIQAAIDTRDNAVIAAFDAYNSAVKTALITRQSALKNAWAITNRMDRKTALKKAWSDYMTTVKNARKASRDAKHQAWQTFNHSRKACGLHATADDRTGEGVDRENND